MFKSKVKIKILGRAGLIYQDGKKKMKINSEMLSGNNYDMVIYKDSMLKWEAPYNHIKITHEDKNLIIDNINEKLKKIRIDWQ